MTKDVDFLGRGDPSSEVVAGIVRAIVAIGNDHGLRFDPESISRAKRSATSRTTAASASPSP